MVEANIKSRLTYIFPILVSFSLLRFFPHIFRIVEHGVEVKIESVMDLPCPGGGNCSDIALNSDEWV
jgi:hypothetical protein